ncbi:MAG: DUF3368 domain-containing protein [Nitrospirae bacterium]|nr:DUF3368 domain-containing protein [Nitrospirota bacterium]
MTIWWYVNTISRQLITPEEGITAARLFASLMGLEVHGSLGVVLWAAAAGHLTHAEAHAILNRLARSSFWISEQTFS